MIQKNETWDLVNRLEDRKITDVKWVFRTKLNADGSINNTRPDSLSKGTHKILVLIILALLLLLPDQT